MSVRPSKVIGIVGGLGPYAHIEFELLLLAATVRRLGRPPRDQDYPEWVVSSIPGTPDRTLALLGRAPSPVPALLRSLHRLATAGADLAVIPCNTAHAFLDELRAGSPIPILDMIALTLERAREQAGSPTRIGLMATTGTCRARVYHERAERIPGLELVTLLDLEDGEEYQEQLVMAPIYGARRDGERTGGGLKAGVRTDEIVDRLRRAVRLLADAGAALVIAGCTEIPLGLGRGTCDGTPLLDPMELAATRAIDLVFGDLPPT